MGTEIVERGRGIKRKTRWSEAITPAITTSSLNLIPKYFPSGLTMEQQEALMVRIRIDEITKKLTVNDFFSDAYATDGRERSPSPPPIYDSQGKRTNTREQRVKNKLIEERSVLITVAKAMNPQFKPPPDYVATPVKYHRKITIPIEKYPEYNFIGLIIGPRGNTQKRMEKETGCKISIRGKGSVKDGSKKPQPDENEPLHVLVTGDIESAVDKAAKMVEKLLVPIDETLNEHKKAQLKELAEINGTLRDRSWYNRDTERSFTPSNVRCVHCGEVSHASFDCPFKSGVPQEKIQSEYDKFLAELGDPTAGTPSAPVSTVGAPLPGNAMRPSAKDESERQYQEFLAAIEGEGGQAQAQAQFGAVPWAQPGQGGVPQQYPPMWGYPPGAVPWNYPPGAPGQPGGYYWSM